VEGNGQKELVDMLFGFSRPNGGSIQVNGENLIGLSQREIRRKHVSLVPEDRMLYGIAPTATIEENLISDRSGSPEFNRGILFNISAIHKKTEQLIKDYTVLCKNGRQQVGSLSGGNIQKVVVAREFTSGANFVIANQPTRGVDVGTAEMIRKYLVRMTREKGIGSLLISADLNEVLEVSDRLFVMRQGKIVAAFPKANVVDVDVLGEYMLGIKTMTAEEMEGLL
jgi:simple sugar transport system ATP-binding protein